MPIIREEPGESFDETDRTHADTLDDQAILDTSAEFQNPAPEPSESSNDSALMLFICLDKLYYIAFERVSGEIVLNVPHSMPPCELVLASSGKELLKVYETPGSPVYSDSKKALYRLESTIAKWENELSAGQYVFPFTFKLPEYVPSTFNF
jgi:hypothetical protein